MLHLPTNTPLGRLRILEVYREFDGPKLFACENASGQRFLALWLGDGHGGDQWLFVPTSNDRLEQVRSGKMALRQACLDAEDGLVWIVEVPHESSRQAAASSRPAHQLPEEFLPRENSYLIPTAALPQTLKAQVWQKVDQLRARLSGKSFSLTQAVLAAREEEDDAL